MATIVLRTSDTAWIAAHDGRDAGDGKIVVEVDAVEDFTFCGRAWIRHQFDRCPADALNSAIVCPRQWVDDLAGV